jgi:NADPH-dependent F420 reductase
LKVELDGSDPMDVAILGGTGDLGEGLALRWAGSHTVHVGSRDADRGRGAAAEYRDRSVTDGDGTGEVPIAGGANGDVAAGARVVVLSVPPYHVESTVESIADRLDPGTILLSPAVGITQDDCGWHYHAPPAGSVTALVAEAAPEACPVVGALHNVPAEPLSDPTVPLDLDTPVVGDDEGAVERVCDLVSAIEGITPVRAGPVDNAPEVESLVPLLLNVERHGYEGEDLSIRFTG